MGSDVVGEFNYAVSFVLIFQGFVINGLGSTNISLINKNPQDINRSQNTLVLLVYATYSIYVAIILSLSYHMIFEDNSKLFYLILIVILTEYIGLWFTISKSYYYAKIDQFKASFPEFIRITITKIMQIISVIVFYDILGLALSVLLSTILCIPVLLKYSPKISFQFPSLKFIVNYLKTALRFTTFTLNKLVPQQLDKIILESIITFSFLGYYVIGQKIGNTIEIIAMSIGVVLFPFFTKLGREKNESRAKEVITNFLSVFYNGIAFLLFLFCFFSMDLLIIVFGDDYHHSSTSMVIYIILGIFSIMSIPFNNIALGFGSLKKISVINVISFGSFILAAILVVIASLNEQEAIDLMSLARLLPYVILLIFFVLYCEKLLITKFYKSLLLVFTHTFIFVSAHVMINYLQYDRILIVSLFAFVYFILNELFGYHFKKTIEIILSNINR